MSETTINDFSLLCRLFGNLFYREPTDPILAGTFQWLAQGGLRQQWALSTDSQSEQALNTVQQLAHPAEQAVHFQALFAKNGSVSTAFPPSVSLDAFLAFRQARGMPPLAQPNHVALLLLTASWIEDHLHSTQAQQALFTDFLLPSLSAFLGQVEAFDRGFYKALAQLCRDALGAMADELEEQAEDAEAILL